MDVRGLSRKSAGKLWKTGSLVLPFLIMSYDVVNCVKNTHLQV
jgi:hypothetical protein